MGYSSLLLLLASLVSTCSNLLSDSEPSTTWGASDVAESASNVGAGASPLGSHSPAAADPSARERSLAAEAKVEVGPLVPEGSACFLDADCPNGSVCVIFDDDPNEAPKASHCEFVEIPGESELL